MYHVHFGQQKTKPKNEIHTSILYENNSSLQLHHLLNVLWIQLQCLASMLQDMASRNYCLKCRKIILANTVDVPKQIANQFAELFSKLFTKKIHLLPLLNFPIRYGFANISRFRHNTFYTYYPRCHSTRNLFLLYFRKCRLPINLKLQSILCFSYLLCMKNTEG